MSNVPCLQLQCLQNLTLPQYSQVGNKKCQLFLSHAKSGLHKQFHPAKRSAPNVGFSPLRALESLTECCC